MANKPSADRDRSLPPAFDLKAFLDSAGLTRRVIKFKRNAIVFAQGASADSVVLRPGGRRAALSVVFDRTRSGRAMLGPGDFFGEGCLAAQSRRIGTAKAIILTSVMRISKVEMIRTLHQQPELADRFLQHMLARNIRIEEDLVDQLFNSSEKRLARTLLLLARYGTEDTITRSCQSCLRRRWQRWWAQRGPA